MKRIFSLFGFVALIAIGVQPLAAAIIVKQPPAVIAAPDPIGFSSLNDVLGEFMRAYDNFSLALPFSVTKVSWRGQYTERLSGTTMADDFDLIFWSDDADKPGLPKTVLSGVAVTETLFEAAREIYDYVADISGTPFDGAANTQYWLSVVANIPDDTVLWDWHLGQGGDGRGFQDLDDDPTKDGIVSLGEHRIKTEDFAATGDFTFTLEGTVIPEPASGAVWLVLAIGGFGVGIVRRALRPVTASRKATV